MLNTVGGRVKNFIPDEVIEEVRQNCDIVQVVSEYVLLTRKGHNYFGLCPFHGEKTPSFSVSPDKQIFYCFGCGVGGNVFSFLMQKEGMEFPEAVKLLADKVGVEIPEGEVDSEYDQKKSALKKAHEINNLTKEFYHYILLNLKVGELAREYLKKRGLSPEVIDKFQLGYAPNSWDGLLNFLTKKNNVEDDLVKQGLILSRNEGQGFYDRFRHRLMFPIWDVKGNVIGFGGRVLDKGEPKYLNSPESFVYNKRENLFGIHLAVKAIREQDRVLIAEGYLDVITAHQFGFENVVASLGTALTKEQIKLLMRYTHNIIVAFDADGAGVKATLRSIDLLQNFGCKVKILTIPNGKDPDEYIRKKGPIAFKKLIEQAKSLVDYKLDKALEKYGSDTPEAKARVVEALSETLLNISNEVEKEMYLKKTAETLGLQLETIIAELKKQQQKGTKHWKYRDKQTENWNNTNMDNAKSVVIREKNQSARSKAEKFLLRLVIEEPNLWLQAKSKMGISFFDSPERNQIAKVIDALCIKEKNFEIADIFSYLKDSNSNKVLNQILAQEVPLENLEESFYDCLLVIEREIKKESKDSILRKISEAEQKGDFEQVRFLMKELKQFH